MPVLLGLGIGADGLSCVNEYMSPVLYKDVEIANYRVYLLSKQDRLTEDSKLGIHRLVPMEDAERLLGFPFKENKQTGLAT